MSGAYDELVQRHAAAGAARFARWDAALFGDLTAGPGKRLFWRVSKKPGAAAIANAYLSLAVEAVGLGYVDRASFDAMTRTGRGAQNLVALLWVQRLADHPYKRAPEVEIATIARAFNVGEGLIGEAPWLCRYVTSALSDLASVDDLEARVVAALEPALSVRAPAAFGGPFAVSVLDATDVDDQFLPGEMHLVAPAVLCVHDRKREGVAAGVLLQQAGASSLLPLGACLGERAAEDGAPEVELLPSRLRVGEHRVALPTLRFGHRAIASRAGFCVASAVDSQRLWVVESP